MGDAGPSIEEITSAWAARNACDVAAGAVVAVSAEVDHLRWACSPGTDVGAVRVNGGGHAWPGSAFSRDIESVIGHTTFDIDATELIWTFFVAHPLTGVR